MNFLFGQKEKLKLTFHIVLGTIPERALCTDRNGRVIRFIMQIDFASKMFNNSFLLRRDEFRTKNIDDVPNETRRMQLTFLWRKTQVSPPVGRMPQYGLDSRHDSFY